jgi:potassium-transporting ATPase potassium-binding subunit
MTANGFLQIGVYFLVLLALVKPLGRYMARVYAGQPVFLSRPLAPVERLLYQLCGVQPGREMSWATYAVAVLLFGAVSAVLLYAIQRMQGLLPLNPRGFGAVRPDLAFNTAVSFVTNTNWQNYGGETTMSYLTQMLGLTVQNFASAATGMAVLMALIRGFARHSAHTIGNFWVDLVRGTLYILLPLSLVVALLLVSQGVVQTLSNYRTALLLQPATYDQISRDAEGRPITDPSGNPIAVSAQRVDQLIAVGPVASQLAIKHVGTNGGGFFNSNAAHPFENPTPFSDFLLVLSQSVIAAALTYTFGKMVGDTRQGWALLAAMFAVLLVAALALYAA